MNPPPQTPPAPPVSEESVWSAPSAAWFADHVQPHESTLRRWLTARFPRLRDIDDLIHDAYLKLFKAHATGDVRNPRTYLFSTARNAALDQCRHNAIVPFEPLEHGAEEEDGTDLRTLLSREQELAILREAVSRLPDRCRQVFVLRTVYELSHAEIGDKLKITRATVEAQMNRAMRACAAHLRRYGLP